MCGSVICKCVIQVHSLVKKVPPSLLHMAKKAFAPHIKDATESQYLQPIQKFSWSTHIFEEHNSVVASPQISCL